MHVAYKPYKQTKYILCGKFLAGMSDGFISADGKSVLPIRFTIQSRS